MAKRRSKRKQTEDPAVALKFQQRLREGFGIFSFAVCIFLLLSLFSYHRTDPGWSTLVHNIQVANLAGRAGAWIADVVLYAFGYLGYLFPLLMAYLSWQLFHRRSEDHLIYQSHFFMLRTLGYLILVTSFAGFASLHCRSPAEYLPFTAGGVLGNIVAFLLASRFNTVGATVLLLTGLFISITLCTGFSWLKIADWIGEKVLNAFSPLSNKLTHFEFRQSTKTPKFQPPKKPKVLFEHEEPVLDLSQELDLKPEIVRVDTKPAIVRAEAKPDLSPKTLPISEIPVMQSAVKQKPVIQSQTQPPRHTEKVLYEPALEGTLPPLDLLDPPDNQQRRGFTNQQLEDMSNQVEIKLADFGITAHVVAVHPGPVVTRFELQLAAGTKVSKISTLAKDLARSLSVISVRVVEVIPGKSVIGLELPNQHRETVRLREIFASQRYAQSTSPLTLGIGKDIAGHPVVLDIAKMPHLLVAGTTGSGKSIGLNAMLLSLLYKSTPKQLRLIMIDPKMLEFSIYEGIPHLLTPVVTDMKDAANALRWCVAEMDRRYKLMAALGVRNLAGFNLKVQEAQKRGTPIIDPLWEPKGDGERPPHCEEIPYIVVLADEFADMMMVVGKKVEELIARIAQKARAAGIHLILATQRPSVDVITGLIKANIPTRIAFQVSSKIDSRTILDQQGAEQLLGHGDLLYLPPGTAVPIRVHGAFVADEEVHRVVRDLKRRGKPDYQEEILRGGNDEGISGLGGFSMDEDGEKDELYDQAVRIVTETRRASISSVQRRLKIGYNRAARLMETMESAGVVGPMESNGAREVLAPPPVEAETT